MKKKGAHLHHLQMVTATFKTCFFLLSTSALDEHTEELLTLHEKEIQKLKEERRIKVPILTSVKKYFEICEEERELAVRVL